MSFQWNKNKYSIIVPIFHGQKYIPSMIAQLEACARTASDTQIELIFSNDAPEKIPEETFSSDIITVKIVNTDRNRGIHGARVRGFLYSTGDYIVFLDQDDTILPDYFSSQLKAIGSADAVICNAVSGGRLKYNADRPLPKAADRESMIGEGNMILSPGQVLLRRDAVPGSWIKNVMRHNGADDWLLWLCMHSENRRFVINEAVLFFREVHYNNTSFDSRKMTASEQEVVNIIEREHLLSAKERKKLKELLPKLQDNRIRENQKWKKMFLMLNDWFRACNAGVSVGDYLESKKVKKIAVYGYGYLGKTLCELLKNGNVEISYVIDKNAAFLEAEHRCCTMDDTLEAVDAVIVTIVSGSKNAIADRLKEKPGAEILWLEDMIAEMSLGIVQDHGAMSLRGAERSGRI